MKTFSEFPTTEFPDDAGNQISGVTNKLKVVEDYRYWASIALFAFYSLIAILSFIGVCVKSKVCHHFVIFCHHFSTVGDTCNVKITFFLVHGDRNNLRSLFRAGNMSSISLSATFWWCYFIRLLSESRRGPKEFYSNAR